MLGHREWGNNAGNMTASGRGPDPTRNCMKRRCPGEHECAPGRFERKLRSNCASGCCAGRRENVPVGKHTTTWLNIEGILNCLQKLPKRLQRPCKAFLKTHVKTWTQKALVAFFKTPSNINDKGIFIMPGLFSKALCKVPLKPPGHFSGCLQTMMEAFLEMPSQPNHSRRKFAESSNQPISFQNKLTISDSHQIH